MKVSDYAYKAQCASDLWLVMERIDDAVPHSRYNIWDEFADSEQAQFDDWMSILNDKPIKVKSTAGLRAFQFELSKHRNKNELWVAYAASVDVPQGSLPQGVEMYVAVATTPGAPMVKHNGIQRSIAYDRDVAKTQKAQKEGHPLPLKLRRHFHDQLSLLLHAFAAKVMLMRDSHKLYLVVWPMDIMREIIKEALPNDSFDHQISSVTELSETTSPVLRTSEALKIYDRARRDVVFSWDLKEGTMQAYQKPVNKDNYRWFDSNSAGGSGSGTLLTVNLDALARYGFPD